MLGESYVFLGGLICWQYNTLSMVGIFNLSLRKVWGWEEELTLFKRHWCLIDLRYMQNFKKLLC